MARKHTRDVVDVNITENQGFVAITMKWKDYYMVDDRSEVILWSDDVLRVKLPKPIKEREKEKLDKKVKTAVSNFGKAECDALIKAFGLDELYTNEYENKREYKVIDTQFLLVDVYSFIIRPAILKFINI
jgi:hypothetical protein